MIGGESKGRKKERKEGRKGKSRVFGFRYVVGLLDHGVCVCVKGMEGWREGGKEGIRDEVRDLRCDDYCMYLVDFREGRRAW